MKYIRYLLLMLLTVTASVLFAQTPVTIEFNDSGQVTSIPPEIMQFKFRKKDSLKKGNNYINFKINVSNEAFNNRVNKVFGEYLDALTVLIKIDSNNIYHYGFKKVKLPELIQVRNELFTQLNSMHAEYHSILNFRYAVVLQQISASGICSDLKAVPPSYLPAFDSLITFKYYIEINQFDIHGKPMEATCNAVKKEAITCPGNCHDYLIDSIEISKDCSYFTYKLFRHNFYFNSLLKLNSVDAKFYPALSGLKNNSDFIALSNVMISSKGDSIFNNAVEVLKAIETDSKFATLYKNFISDTLSKIISAYHSLNLDDVTQSDFVLSFLWLNKGLPSINPFENLRKSIPVDTNLFIHFNNHLIENNQMYSGILFTNQKKIGCYKNKYKSNFVMRNHDALNDYAVMNKTYIREIPQNKTMKILAYNEQEQNKLKLTFTETPESDTDSYFTFLVNGRENPLKAILTKMSAYVMPNDSELTVEFIRIYHAMQFFKNGFPQLPPQEIVDEHPDFVTREVKHIIKGSAPERVNYTINKVDTANNQSKLIPLDSNTYRINKLYHFRFKVGISYSWLNTDDYDVTTNPVTKTTHTEGFNVVTGLQYFFKPQDIRNPGLKVRPFVFGGFAIKGKVYDYPYIGIGTEPLNGLGFMVGMNWAKSERLDYSNGLFVTDNNHFKSGMFVSVILDLNLFNQLFSVPSITAPYK